MRYFSTGLLALFVNAAFAQMNPSNPSFPSKEIALSKQSVEIDNDLFNGRVNVSVPLLTYEYDGIPVSIGLSYTGNNGIKPDELPGWVGTGWNLNTGGGYISRTVRGRPDEVRDFETRVYNYIYPWNQPKKETILSDIDYSYFANKAMLNVSNWSTGTYANSLSPGINNQTYSLHRTEDVVTVSNEHPTYDLVPDEFTFSFAGVSGKFYLNSQNEWIVQASNEKTFDIDVQTGPQTVVDYIASITGNRIHYQCPRIIKYITMTSRDGFRYYFGNPDKEAPFNEQQFDYSHSSHTLSSLNSEWPNSPPGTFVSGNISPTYVDLVPTAWHLTKIENLKTGNVTTFSYKQDGLEFYKTQQAWGYGNINAATSVVMYKNDHMLYSNTDDLTSWYYLSAISKVVSRKWTLTSINFSNGVQIKFESSQSTQLSTSDRVWDSDNAGVFNYEDMYYRPGITGAQNVLLKLDKILVDFDDVTKKEIQFGYDLSESDRLQLQSVKQKGSAGNFTNEYLFQYKNEIVLPDYGKGKSDHWGYFNNKNFFETETPPFSHAELLTYGNYRAADANFSSAEILTRVIYPTGGFVDFEYEPHSYSQSRTLGSVTDHAVNAEAGGMRIKTVKYYTGTNELAKLTSFEYKIPGTSLSSGVLAITPSAYVVNDNQTAGLFNFAATGFSPNAYEGSNVTYTYASAIESGNGRMLYKFSNYNTGFNDMPADVFNNTSQFYQFYSAYKHNSFKRGKPVSVKIFDETGFCNRETKYEYVHDGNEFGTPEVRSLYLSIFASPNNFHAAVAERIYTDHLIKQEEIENTPSGSYSTTTQYSYGGDGNLASVITSDSKDWKIVQKFKYVSSFQIGIGNDAICKGIEKLIGLNIKNALVETVTYRENSAGTERKLIGAKLNTYNGSTGYPEAEYDLELSGSLDYANFTNANISGPSFNKDERYVLKSRSFENFSDKGDLLQYSGIDRVKNSFEYGYNGTYPVVKIRNARNDVKVTYQPQSSSISIPATVNNGASLTTYYTGDIVFSMTHTSPPSKSFYINISVSGPRTESFQLCFNWNNPSYCGPSSGQTFTLTNMPAGTYNISVAPANYPQVNVICAFQGRETIVTGLKEFYYQGFEQNYPGAYGVSYAGKFGYPGDFTVNFAKPTARDYVIDYFYLDGSEWKYIKKPYDPVSNTMTLSEGSSIDEVRIYPADAFIETSTFDPIIGATSISNSNGITIKTEYDEFGRKAVTRDNKGNILEVKKYELKTTP